MSAENLRKVQDRQVLVDCSLMQFSEFGLWVVDDLITIVHTRRVTHVTEPAKRWFLKDHLVHGFHTGLSGPDTWREMSKQCKSSESCSRLFLSVYSDTSVFFSRFAVRNYSFSLI